MSLLAYLFGLPSQADVVTLKQRTETMSVDLSKLKTAFDAFATAHASDQAKLADLGRQVADLAAVKQAEAQQIAALQAKLDAMPADNDPQIQAEVDALAASATAALGGAPAPVDPSKPVGTELTPTPGAAT